MASDGVPQPLCSLEELLHLSMLSAVLLQLGSTGAYLCIDNGGTLATSSSLTPDCTFLICQKPVDGQVVHAFLSSDAKWALTLQAGWLTNSIALVDKERQPLSSNNFFTIQLANPQNGQCSEDQKTDSAQFLLVQGDQYVCYKDATFTTVGNMGDATLFHLHSVPNHPWPYPVQLLQTIIHFDRPEGRPDIVSAWDGSLINQLFDVEEGVWQTETLHFHVHRPVKQLRKVTMTYKLGILVDTTTVTLGDFDARDEPYLFTFPRNEVPEGMFVRGAYSQIILFESDEGIAFLPADSQFQIVAKAE